MKKRPKSGGVGAAPWCPARPRRSRRAQQRLINHSAPRRDGGPRLPPPIPAPLPQKQPSPCTGFKGFCACACVCCSVSPLPLLFFVCVYARKSWVFSSFLGSVWHQGSDHVKSKGRIDRQTDEAGEPATIAQRLGGSSERRKGRVGGHGDSCGANESKINIYMGRVLKPYFASL